jgi:uracil phosphoribosyltransferase
VTFIGEYFGFDASFNNFAVVWTDTRTGVQELFFGMASIVLTRIPIHIPEEVITILAGIIADGGGIIMVDGVIIHVGPGDPMIDILNAIAAMDAVERIKNAGARQAMSSLRQIIANVVHEER